MLQLGWIRSPKSYIHVSHVTCMHCMPTCMYRMLHVCIACCTCLLRVKVLHMWLQVTMGRCDRGSSPSLDSKAPPFCFRALPSALCIFLGMRHNTLSACCCAPYLKLLELQSPQSQRLQKAQALGMYQNQQLDRELPV